MHVQRLIRLAELLEADAANPNGVKFDLGFWAIESSRMERIRDGKELTESTYKVGQVIPIDCGTAACAVGLAVLSGAFTAEGLEYELDTRGNLEPKFGTYKDWGAVCQFFDITDAASNGLFTSSAYPVSRGAEGELAVANRIREFVNGTWKAEEPDDDIDDEDED